MRWPLFLVAVLFSSLWFAAGSARGANSVSFADDVQPILRRHCFRCHGSKNQEAGLQLNDREEAFANDELIQKHSAEKSLLIGRLTNKELGDIMPLDGEPLTNSEIDVLSKWIDEGASWPVELAKPKHWAYQPIARPVVPVVDSQSQHTAIDQFILERLKSRGIEPSMPLDRARLIRRVSLALTGIPPSPAEVQQFIDDQSPNAYEKVVDRLLESQHYGERWAVPWLDLARYADSNGFQADQIRDNWAYRDWVIRAFNQDLPFNEFVIDQIAGDLRPNATNDQKIATGFHRMTTCNVEAGVHPEANRTNQIVDRVNTTATVFMGTTLECAQCHDHKYDPFTQKDYYQIFAYFNNTPLEVKNTSGVTWDFYGPTMDLPMDDAKKKRFRELDEKLTALQADRAKVVKEANADYAPWLGSIRKSLVGKPQWHTVVPAKFESTGKEVFAIEDDGAILLSGDVPDKVEHVFTFVAADEFPQDPITAIRVDLLTDKSIPGKGPGRGDPKRTNVILSEITCQVIDGKDASRVKLTNPTADFSQTGWHVSQAIDGDRRKGWAIAPQFGKPHWASFVLAEPVTLKSDARELRVTLDQQFGSGRVAGKPRVSVFTGDPAVLAIDEEIRELAVKKKPSKAEKRKLRAEFDKKNPRLTQIDAQIKETTKLRDALKPDTTLVMVEMEKPRETFVMIRGDYENLADRVAPGFPEVLPDDDRIKRTGDRLEFARWLTSRKNPLLARVTVNRWWGELFGTGLVNTPEDFGTQAETPSHPRLLDWLSMELMDSGWSMKHVHKLMVMSSTFQQEARVTKELLAADPNNRMLARGPRFRLPAESIRDNALAISGLLSPKMYGPPIMPFQPTNIWRSVGRNQPKWKPAESDDRFRRGVYVICKRAAPYPSFINFDAPDRGSCTVNRGRTNTPLQALTLLNDPAYAEMALAMADRVLSESDAKTDDERMAFAMKLAVARDASTFELSVLNRLLNDERRRVADDPDVIKSRTKVPFDAMKLRSDDRAELAAWFAVTNAILNLDETMSQ